VGKPLEERTGEGSNFLRKKLDTAVSESLEKVRVRKERETMFNL